MRMRSAVASLTAHTKPKFCDKWPCQRWPWGWGWGAPGARTRGGSRPANIEEEAPPLPLSPAPPLPRSPAPARARHVPPRPPPPPSRRRPHRLPPSRPPGQSAEQVHGQRRGSAGAAQGQDRCRAAELHTPPPHPPPGPPPPSSPSRVAHGASRHLLLFEDTLVDALAELAEVLAHHRERDRLGQLPGRGWGWGRVRVRVRRALHLPARSVACVCVARRHRGHGGCGCDLLSGHRPATEPAPLRHPLRRAVSHHRAPRLSGRCHGAAWVGVPLGQGGCEAGSGAGRVHGGLQRALSQQPAPWRARPPAGAQGRRLLNTRSHGMKSLTCPSCSGLRASAWSAMRS